MIKLKSTVLDMWSMNSKSNGALAWSTSTDFKCNETFHKDFYSSSGESRLRACASRSFPLGRCLVLPLKAALMGDLGLIHCQRSPSTPVTEHQGAPSWHVPECPRQRGDGEKVVGKALASHLPRISTSLPLLRPFAPSLPHLMLFSEIPPLGSVSLPKSQPQPVIHSLQPEAGVKE